MNTDVTVTGMQVIAKTDDTYLIISKTNNTASAIQAENDNKGFITVAMGMDASSSKVFASAPCLSNEEKAYLTTSGKTLTGDAITTEGDVIDDFDSAAAVTNWYTAKALNATASTIDATTARQLTSGDFSKYVIKKTVYLTVAKGANDAYHLTVTGTFESKDEGNAEDLGACKVLVVSKNSKVTTGGGFAVLSSDNTSAILYNGDTDVIDDETVITVDMYIFYDGNHEKVYTNNVAKLAGAEFGLSFGVTAVPQA